jgi:Fe-S-cluster-containing dehydrogenase component
MKKWTLIVDVARCNGCYNCVLADQDEHIDNDYPGYAAPQPRQGAAWIRIERVVRGSPPMVDAAYLPKMCNHCDNAPCVAAGRGAVKKRKDGIVIFDPVLTRGRRDLVDVCPYGAVRWNEALQIPQIWTFDAHLLDQGWREPRCVQACPTGALRATKVSDAQMWTEIKRGGLVPLNAEWGTRPRIYYRNLHRHHQCFVGGSVAVDVDGRSDFLKGAEVVLQQRGRILQRVCTDAFGDFKFERLERDSGRYRVDIKHPEHGALGVDIELGESRYLGVMTLSRTGNPSPADSMHQPQSTLPEIAP